VRKPPVSTLTVWLDRLRAVYRALVRVRPPRIFGLVLRNPRDSMCAAALMLAVTAIVANGLYLQPGRHPAPIFAVRPLPVKSDETTAMASSRSRPEAEAPRPGSSPGSSRPDSSRPESSRSESSKSEAAARNDPAPKDSVPMPRPRAHGASAARSDPGVEGANPSWQVSAVQRTLNQAGYGPLKVSGILDDPTREGIARFERAHNLPVTGQNTARVRHALSAVTGRTLD
jgi:hypothetical protein